MAAADDDDLPRMLGGRYRLEATIGHGGMGVVYRGIDLTMQRPVAVKLIRSVDGQEIDDEVAGRFLREAKHTAKLQHEHIIDVFDLGRDPNGMYFVMELLTGESLSAKIRREGKLAPDQVVHIGIQICQALEVAHRASVIHRDLKPANIMLVSRAGDDAFVKVLDFGVAKSVAGDDQTQLTHTGMLVGTVDYMAPEQIMGKTVDGRTDVYSLGVMLYKMLSGKNPFRDGGVPALIHAHLNTMPKPLIEMAEGIPNELDHVVLRCLMKNPDRRFESMAELARALAHTQPSSEPQLMDLEYRPADAGFDDQTVTGGSDDGFRDSEPPPEDATISDSDPTRVKDMKIPPRRLTPQELGLPPGPTGLRAHEGSQPLPLPPKPRPLISTSSHSGPVFGPPVFFPEELSTQKRSVPPELMRSDRSEPKICAMCQTKNPPHALACAACGVSLGTSEQDALRIRNRSGPPSRAPQSLPPVPIPPAPSSSRRNLGGGPPSGPPPPNSMGSRAPQPMPPQVQQYPSFAPQPQMQSMPPQMQMPAPQANPYPMQPQWLPPQQPQPMPPPPATTWQRFLRWTGLKSR